MTLACIKCGVAGNMWLDADSGKGFLCTECNEQTTVDEIEEHVANWQKMLAWAATHPARQTPECKPVAGKVG